jgi:hypothetical protein
LPYILLIIVLIIFLLYKYHDYIPPQTPLNYARIESNLNLEKSNKILEFDENYSFTGEGYRYIKIKINVSQIKSIILSCKEEKYKLLTQDNLITDGFLNNNTEYGISLPKGDIKNIKGFYKLEAKDLKELDFGISILDTLNQELIIYRNIP